MSWKKRLPSESKTMFCLNGHICKMIKVGACLSGFNPVLSKFSCLEVSSWWSVTCRTLQPKRDWIFLDAGGAGGSFCTLGHSSAWEMRLEKYSFISVIAKVISPAAQLLPCQMGWSHFQTLQKSLGALFKRKTTIFNRGILKLDIIKHYCICCLSTVVFCCCCF